MREYELDRHHLRLLAGALQAWDRAESARKLVAEDGLVVADRFGQARAHPAVKIERDSMNAFRLLMRQIDLEGEPTALYRRP